MEPSVIVRGRSTSSSRKLQSGDKRTGLLKVARVKSILWPHVSIVVVLLSIPKVNRPRGACRARAEACGAITVAPDPVRELVDTYSPLGTALEKKFSRANQEGANAPLSNCDRREIVHERRKSNARSSASWLQRATFFIRRGRLLFRSFSTLSRRELVDTVHREKLVPFKGATV